MNSKKKKRYFDGITKWCYKIYLIEKGESQFTMELICIYEMNKPEDMMGPTRLKY